MEESDSIASLQADSAAVAVHPWDVATSTLDDAPMAVGRERSTTTGVAPFMHGIMPEPRTMLPGYDSNVMTLLIVVFLFFASNFRNYGTFINKYVSDLWKVRRREDFYARHTIGENGVLFSLMLITVVCEGILAFSVMNYCGKIDNAALFTSLMAVTGVTAAYYAAQLVIYNVVGYTFSDSEKTGQWLKGFNASQTLLGITLVVPAMLALFNTGAVPLLASLGLLLYVTARIIFICKGFRLFYDKIGSLLYFILYLCSLEIIPVLLALKAIL